jgi:Ser/Thr protein kinase RdoA (MazF antagonist)
MDKIKKRICLVVKREFGEKPIIKNTGGWTENTFLIYIGRDSYILKVRKDPKIFEKEVLVALQNKQFSFEIPKIIKDCYYSPYYFRFYTILKGKVKEKKSDQNIIDIGICLAEFHKKTRNLKFSSQPPFKSYTKENLSIFLGNLPSFAPPQYINLFYKAISELGYEDYGLVHNDFCNGNILFSRDKISGIVDFENAHIDLRVKDVANTILYDCYDYSKNSMKNRYVNLFLNAYNSKFPLDRELKYLKRFIVMKIGIQSTIKKYSKKEIKRKLEWILKTNAIPPAP